VDSRILVAQVPGGMLTNLENQLREQNASDRLDEVLEEIPKVREDLGNIPLVTPTSQIVGTQSVINVLLGERYKNIAKETAGVLKGEYGATPAPLNAELQSRVLDGQAAITRRPADLIEPELDKLIDEVQSLAIDKGFDLAEQSIDDVLTYALFHQVGLRFLENRNNPAAFEPAPTAADASESAGSPTPIPSEGPSTYTVRVNGTAYVVEVSEGGEVLGAEAARLPHPPVSADANTIVAALAGNIFKVLVAPGEAVTQGQSVLVLEAMKMETDVSAPKSGTVTDIHVAEGDAVAVGEPLFTIA
jgi:oxaloacetate decarboxylase alpha subunit